MAPSTEDSEANMNLDNAADDAPSKPDPLSEAPVAKKAKKSKKVRAKPSGEPQPYENGVLRAIELQNFMNHKHLRIDFDPHVNFIVGKNGSGKSAIVNSLVAGFGHRVQSTGRNLSAVKGLVRHGADYASIAIHIANGGEDAWKVRTPDLMSRLLFAYSASVPDLSSRMNLVTQSLRSAGSSALAQAHTGSEMVQTAPRASRRTPSSSTCVRISTFKPTIHACCSHR